MLKCYFHSSSDFALPEAILGFYKTAVINRMKDFLKLAKTAVLHIAKLACC